MREIIAILNEMPGKDDIERIVRDMKNFERGK